MSETEISTNISVKQIKTYHQPSGRIQIKEYIVIKTKTSSSNSCLNDLVLSSLNSIHQVKR